MKTKIQLITVLFLSGLFACSPMLNAQNLPLNDPTTKDQWTAFNSEIAHAFAPIYYQFYNNKHGDDGVYDIPVPVNFDGDWNHLNNWENASDANCCGVVPTAYYHVFWDATFWKIVYSFYHPRDYARNTNLGCGGTDHEGDVERVFVFVERPTSESYVVKDLLKGYTTVNHSYLDYVNCVAENQMFSFSGNPVYANGTHPWVYASAGSHAIYKTRSRAKDDATSSGTDWCRPKMTDGNTIQLLPVQPNASTGPGDLMSSTGYRLIDINDSSSDLWSKRNSSSVFLSAHLLNRSTQKFNGDDSDKASAPWNGDGYNPNAILGDLLWIKPSPWPWTWYVEPFGMPFTCACKTIPSDPCTPTTAPSVPYTFNGLKCGEYRTLTPYINSDDKLVFRIQTSSAYNPATDDISWSINSPIDFSCSGCSSGSKTITLTPIDPDCDQLVNVTATATISSIECGATNLYKTYNNYQPCEFGDFVSISVEPCSAFLEFENHQSGNTYEWSFTPEVQYSAFLNKANLFTGLSTTSQFIQYTLVVNGTLTLTGTFVIPPCDWLLKVTVQPNPADSYIDLKLETFQADALNSGIDIVISDQYSNIKSSFKTNQEETQIDVSQFQDGLYYIIARDHNGNTVNSTFVVGSD